MMRSLFMGLLLVAGLTFVGCEDKTETLLDVETSDGNVEVERNVETGEVDVRIDSDR
ncbi:hypothetical protein [Roseimaritima sediminicola]|uniref:hypothetical protein n=1 Tax=Roseimaritima sediminicola TaxID=2662066 RepID=UPI00192A5D9C|nr:hypothetical protein [Roseimaritima sediminicola]